MAVDRCVCTDVRFAEMLELRARGLRFEQIRERTGCCQQCGMCEPYVRIALATGRRMLPVLKADEIRAALRIDPDARPAPGMRESSSGV